ncbi:MAG TPA: molybdate ABC transporter substrate-binding protein [Gammaproteobacteria bacterium]
MKDAPPTSLATHLAAKPIEILVVALALAGGAAVRAETATIAVATNFAEPLAELERAFEATGGHELVVVRGSTGQLYAQIANAAPFDVLLAADDETPALLVRARLGVAPSRFTYAIGRLVLWTRAEHLRDALSLDVLESGDFRWIAIASPELAPYGLAARQALDALGLSETLAPKTVQGQNIGQTFAMAATGNADLAFVALAQAMSYDEPAAYVEVPPQLHEPIRQDAVLLWRAADNAAALAFLEFLASDAAVAIIERYGYEVPR